MLMAVPDASKQQFLADALGTNDAAPENWTVYLYTNDYTPDDDSTPGNFTAATFTGSAGAGVPMDEWGATFLVGHVAKCTNAVTPTWTNTGATTETCFGWYAIGNDSGNVRAAQRFDSPRVMSPGSSETLDPFTISLKTFA